MSESNFIKNDIIYIYGEFDNSISKEIMPFFQQKVFELIKTNKTTRENKDLTESAKDEILLKSKIQININSRGGQADCLYPLLNIINLAKKNNIIIETISHTAYSCGSMLACVGTRGCRYIDEYSEHLLHLGATTVRITDKVELQRAVSYAQHSHNRIKAVYLNNSTLTEEIIDQNLQNDNWIIYGSDIITSGLADKMLKDYE